MTAIDATGLHALEVFSDRLRKTGRTLLLCGAREQPAACWNKPNLFAILAKRTFSRMWKRR